VLLASMSALQIFALVVAGLFLAGLVLFLGFVWSKVRPIFKAVREVADTAAEYCWTCRNPRTGCVCAVDLAVKIASRHPQSDAVDVPIRRGPVPRFYVDRLEAMQDERVTHLPLARGWDAAGAPVWELKDGRAICSVCDIAWPCQRFIDQRLKRAGAAQH
jgi:hypothetical protein